MNPARRPDRRRAVEETAMTDDKMAGANDAVARILIEIEAVHFYRDEPFVFTSGTVNSTRPFSYRNSTGAFDGAR